MEDIRDIVDSDYPSILALNRAEEKQTSELDHRGPSMRSSDSRNSELNE
jgi:hypothetical protein